jgi:hypothetical protein
MRQYTPEEHTVAYWNNIERDIYEEMKEAEEDIENSKIEFYQAVEDGEDKQELRHKADEVKAAMREYKKLEHYLSLCGANIASVEDGRKPDMIEWHDRDLYVVPDVCFSDGEVSTDEEDAPVADSVHRQLSFDTCDDSKDITYEPSQEIKMIMAVVTTEATTPTSKRMRTSA